MHARTRHSPARTIELRETAALMRASGGDARRLLNTFELCVQRRSGRGRARGHHRRNWCMQVVQTTAARYDKQGEQHYDIVTRLHQKHARQRSQRCGVLAGPHGGRW
jgi:replication-associated recombination protein RarA